MKPIDLAGKVVLLTGASEGIGKAAAYAFAEAGANLVLAARSTAALESLADELGGPTRALAVPTDVSDDQAVHALVERALSHFGRVDLLINNAGVGYLAPLTRVQPARVRHVLEVNLIGPLTLIQELVPHFEARGDGHIINLLTCAGRLPIPFQGIYGASKAAFTALTDTLRIELAPKHIAVTGVFPGTANTQFEKHALSEGTVRSMCPFEKGCGRPPEAIARAILHAARYRPRDTWLSFQGRRYVITGLFFPRWLDERMTEVRDALDPPRPEAETSWKDVQFPG